MYVSHSFKAILAILLLTPWVCIASEEIELKRPLNTVESLSKQWLSNRNIRCLIDNIYYEAQGEEPIGQIAIAYVTLNRAIEANTHNICKVVYKKHQFAWTRNKKRKLIPKEELTWLRWVAKMAIRTHASLDITEGSTYFVTCDSRYVWMQGLEKVKQIGSHCFYREE